jgi:acyl transferase domain-containing protein
MSSESPQAWDTELFIVSAGDVGALIGRVRQIEALLPAETSVDVKDLAHTLSIGRADGSATLAVVAGSAADLAAKLAHARGLLAEPDRDRIQDARGIYYFRRPLAPEGRLAFLFPGEGSQYQHMLADLREIFPQVRHAFELADSLGSGHEGWVAPSKYIFPPTDLPEDERAELKARLWSIAEVPGAVLLPAYAMLCLLQSLGLRAGAMAGHSAGEYMALVACGAFGPHGDESIAAFVADLRETYQAVSERSLAREAAVFAIAAPAGAVEALLADVAGEAYVAMDNCPHQCVAVVDIEGAEGAMAALTSGGLVYQRLPFDRPYHTPLFEDYALGFESFFARSIKALPAVPLYSCATAAKIPDDLEEFRRLACRQWMMPVRFQETVEAMYAHGVRIFVEVGPRGSLTAFVDEVLKGPSPSRRTYGAGRA